MENIQNIIEEMQNEANERLDICDFETAIILKYFIEKLEKAVEK